MKQYFIYLILYFLFSSVLFAQEEPFWEYLNGPPVGEVNDLIVYNNDIFISSYNGIFRTTNKGEHWDHLLKKEFVYSLSVSKKGVLFCVRGRYSIWGTYLEIYFSTDNGNKWELLDYDWGQYEPWIVKFNNSETLFAVYQRDTTSKVFYSEDYGSHWYECQGELPASEEDFTFWFLDIDNKNNIILGGHKKVNENYLGIIFISDDEGKNWEKIDYIPAGMKSVLFHKNVILAGTIFGLYKSIDRGKTWHNTGISSYICDIRWIDNKLYTFAKEGIYISPDSGQSWTSINSTMSAKGNDYGSSKIKKIDSNSFMTFDYRSIYISHDKGYNWTQINNGFTAALVGNISYDNTGNVYTPSFGFFKGINHCESWQNLGLNEYYLTESICTSQGDIFTGSNYQGLGIFRSIDNGKTWENKSDGLVSSSGGLIHFDDFLISNNNDIFVAVPFITVQRSRNNGEYWEELDVGGGGSKCLAINSEGHIFTGKYRCEIERSTDGGETWEIVNEKQYGSVTFCFFDLLDIEFHPSKPIGYAVGEDCLIKTTDNGRTWFKPDNELRRGGSLAVDSVGNFWLAWKNVWRTTDYGENWEKIDSGLYHDRYTAISVSPDGYIYLAGEYGGIYRSRKNYVSVEEKNKTTDFQLSNYPNPINETTTIEYTIEKSGHVKLSIIDLLGNEITILVDEYQEAGKHSKIVSIDSFPSGVYFYRLEAAGKVETMQMVVVR